LKEWKK